MIAYFSRVPTNSVKPRKIPEFEISQEKPAKITKKLCKKVCKSSRTFIMYVKLVVFL